MRERIKDGGGQTGAEFLARYDPSDHKQLSVSVETVVFGVDSRLQTENIRKLDEKKLTVLLVRRDTHPYLGKWSLPGGFVGIDEPLDSAARRVSRDMTGLDEIYIEQLCTFGEPRRDPRMRIISCAYLSLIDRGKYKLNGAETSSKTAWFEISFANDAEAIVFKYGGRRLTIPFRPRSVRNGKIETAVHEVIDGSPLALDHAALILEGFLRLKGKLACTDIVFNLMPEQFTVSDLQQVYEIILGQKLLTPQFRRSIAPKLTGTNTYVRNKGHRPSQLFAYKNSLARGL